MHPRLTEILQYLARQRDDVLAAIAAVPPGRARDAPAPGRWSAAEVVEHVAIVNARLAARIAGWTADARARGAAPDPDTDPILPSVATARFLDRSRRASAPDAVRPAGGIDLDEARRRFEAAHADVTRAIAAADGIAPADIVHPHGALGPLTMYEWMIFAGAHAARHAAQIREIAATFALEARWTDVDRYLDTTFVPADAALDAALAASAAAGLPAIQVTPTQGRLLHVLARMIGARAILEIGTLGGYSTIWLARALPGGGRLVTLEVSETHAAVARANLARARLDDRVDVRVGPALDTLPAVPGPFDLVFIDADKPSNPDYFRWALRLTRPGAVIVVDNVIRGGAVADPASTDPSVIGVRRLNDLIAAERRVIATCLQTVGAKGYDGFTIAYVAGA